MLIYGTQTTIRVFQSNIRHSEVAFSPLLVTAGSTDVSDSWFTLTVYQAMLISLNRLQSVYWNRLSRCGGIAIHAFLRLVTCAISICLLVHSVTTLSLMHVQRLSINCSTNHGIEESS
jgi:hypothetical protein